MNLNISEPLFLLSAQTGLSASELQARAAKGNPDVQGPQRYMKTGEPIPIVFCRRKTVGSAETGGAMIFPKATEGNFSNNLVKVKLETGGSWVSAQMQERLHVKFLLVASEGQLGSLQVRDMFYGGCRKGTWNQAYNTRAGTWTAGNTVDDYIAFVVPRNADGTYTAPTPVADQTYKVSEYLHTYSTISGGGSGLHLFLNPYIAHTMPVFCGTSGSYSDLTTLSFEIELSPYKDWNKQVSIFVRDGMQVTRIVDSTTGSSDNFVDLAKYLMTQSLKVPTDLIDDTTLAIAANFTNTNNFLFNGAVSDSENLSDWLQKTSYDFLLRLTNTNGKFGLIPRLPYNTDYTIKTTQITPKFEFTEENILPGGFSIDYVSLEDREPICITAQWRQQPEADYGLVRTVDVRYQNEALSGPFASIDLSDYCTTENHAIKVATYKLASRKHLTHYLRIQVREQNYNKYLAVGDIVRVRLRRETSEGEVEFHDFVYEITRIGKTFGSVINYDLTHFPIDSQGRSLVALAVDAAVGAGNVINVGRSTLDCDTNSSTNTSNIGTSSSTPSTAPDSADTSSDIPTPTPSGSDSRYPGSSDSPYPGSITNPTDPINGAFPTLPGGSTGPAIDGNSGTPGSGVPGTTAPFAIVGDTLTFDPGCPNAKINWYLVDNVSGAVTQVSSGVAQPYIVTTTAMEAGLSVYAEGCCPDPGAPGGYATCTQSNTLLLQPDIASYSYVRWNGTTERTEPGVAPVSTTYTSQWFVVSNVNSYITLGGTAGCGLFGIPFYIDGTAANNYTGNVYFYTVETGPVPWRSGVYGVMGASNGFGSWRMGSLATDGLPDPCATGGNPEMLVGWNPTGPNVTYRIQGRWEFSNDASTVETTWGGVDQSVVPDYAVPFNPNHPGG